jgi:DNA-binding SARP family transcriptional activator/Tfp pilus assembly protein PilF
MSPGTAVPGVEEIMAFAQAAAMRFRLLGPLEVWSGQDWAGIGAEKWRALLACLVLKAGQIVPTETLIFELWADTPPPTATNLVSIYVNQLRRAIGDTDGRVLIRRKPGYQLNAGPGDTDLQRFEALVAGGRDALNREDADTAAALLAEAEGLWRGGFLADVPPTMLVSAEAERAMELRVSAAELRIEANLECGQRPEVISELRRLLAEYPLRERLWLLLMRALREAGRHAEALNIYGQARSVIAEELGVDPGPELQQMYAELLSADARPGDPEAASPAGPAGEADENPRGEVPGTIAAGALADFVGAAAEKAGAQAPAEPAGPSRPRPAQLPSDIADFTGRGAQADYLRDALSSFDTAADPGAVRIAVIAGAAGLGKTTLGVHAAHQVQHLFPDGQLYVDLSGASAGPAAPGDVLARFLRDLGVDGGKIPVGDEERAALYRTQLTGRRVLILLDDAKDAAQVRPLLPGSASCAVVVTTRNRTPYLVSTGFVDLNTLSAPEALELFSRIVRDGRPAAEPEATAQLLIACAGLPLAIRICAARLATRGQWRIATMAARLRDERRRLDELQVGDLEVRAGFQVSYDSLRAGRHRADPAYAFRLLGLWPGPRISLAAAAALIGGPEADAADALETLVDANLLESPEPDWYQLHDLLHLFATERAQAEEPAEVRHSAVARLLRWYLTQAETAADVLSPHRYRIAPDEPHAPSPLLNSAEAALAWYDSERTGVIAAIRQAAATGLHDIAWRLATTLFPLFNRRDNWADCITAHQIAVESARRAGQRQAEAWATQNLGQALVAIREEEAFSRLEEALAIRREIGDRVGEAQTTVSLTDAYYELRRPDVAIDYSRRSLEVLRQAEIPALLGIALNNHGEYCLALGRLDEAGDYLQEALDIFQAAGGHGRGHVTENLGRIYLESGRLSEAIARLDEAYRLYLADGFLKGQANALKNLAEAQRRAGLEDQARESLAAAVVLFKELKADAEVEAIQSALAALA